MLDPSAFGETLLRLATAAMGAEPTLVALAFESCLVPTLTRPNPCENLSNQRISTISEGKTASKLELDNKIELCYSMMGQCVYLDAPPLTLPPICSRTRDGLATVSLALDHAERKT